MAPNPEEFAPFTTIQGYRWTRDGRHQKSFRAIENHIFVCLPKFRA